MVGYGWLIDRAGRMDLSTLVRLNIYLFVPAFIFVHLIEAKIVDRLFAVPRKRRVRSEKNQDLKQREEFTQAIFKPCPEHRGFRVRPGA